MPSSSDKLVAILIASAFLWAGIVIGGSLIAAPAKFQVDELTMPVALQIGRITFRWIACAELGLATLVIFFCAIKIFHNAMSWRHVLFAGGAIFIFSIQWLGLMPLLNARSTEIISGSQVEPSNLHLIYVLFELLKVCLLIAFACSLTVKKEA